MCSGAWPNYTEWLANAWGAGSELQATWPQALFQGASNLVFGQNPPYALDDFLSVYRKFFGLPTSVPNAVTTAGSAVVSVTSTTGLARGQFLYGAGLQKGSVILDIGANNVTLNQTATTDATGVTLQVYENAPIPVGVLQLYINLATASLQYVRWREQWFVAMGMFIAHYATLFAKSDSDEVIDALVQSLHNEAAEGAVPGTVYTLSAAPPGGVLNSLTLNGLFLTPGVDYALNGGTITLLQSTSAGDQSPQASWIVQTTTTAPTQLTGAQIAAKGLAGGIQTAKSVGDVSVSYQPLASLEQWGAWQLTSYGQQLATMAAVIGSGPMLVW